MLFKLSGNNVKPFTIYKALNFIVHIMQRTKTEQRIQAPIWVQPSQLALRMTSNQKMRNHLPFSFCVFWAFYDFYFVNNSVMGLFNISIYVRFYCHCLFYIFGLLHRGYSIPVTVGQLCSYWQESFVQCSAPDVCSILKILHSYDTEAEITSTFFSEWFISHIPPSLRINKVFRNWISVPAALS